MIELPQKEHKTMTRLARQAAAIALAFGFGLAILIHATGLRAQQPAGGEKATKANAAGEQKTPRRTMQIRVVNQNDKPIAGAKVHVSVWTEEPFKANQDYACDAQGHTVVDLPNSMNILRLWARKDCYVPLFAHWEQHDPEKPPNEFTFRLKKGTLIGGFVKDEDGKPIAGAKIAVSCEVLAENDGNRVLVNRWLAEEDGVRITNAQGKWTLDNVPEGDNLKIELLVQHPDYVSDLAWGGLQELQNVTLASLRRQTGTIVMYRGISLTGAVTDPEGKPVAGAVVAWGDDPYTQAASHPGTLQEVRTDAKGMYKLPPLPPSLAMTVTVMAQGWAPAMKKVEIKSANPPVDFQLLPGRTLRLKFVDGSGKPVPEVAVGIEHWHGIKSLYNIKHDYYVMDTKIPDKADKNGVYEWTWAPRDQVFYSFWRKGYKTLQGQPFAADGSEHEIKLLRGNDALFLDAE
jgi:uncharacterized GH25 family protein